MVAERHNSLVTGDSVVISPYYGPGFWFHYAEHSCSCCPSHSYRHEYRILRHLILAETALFAARRGTFPDGNRGADYLFEIKIDAVLLIRR